MAGRILVIGSNGYIGRHVCRHLAERGQAFAGADIHDASADGHEYRQLDLLRRESVADVVAAYDRVMVLAGRTGTMDGFRDYTQFIELNELGLLHVLDALKERGPRVKVLFPSSRLVYKGRKDEALKEDADKEFKTIYAANKYAGESYVRMYHQMFGLRYAIVRICVPYGSAFGSAQSYGTISHFVSAAKTGTISIFGTGEQKRSFIHIEDLARLLVLAVNSEQVIDDVYNLGGPDTLSIREIAERVGALFNAEVVAREWDPAQLRIESGDTIFDSSKLLRLLGAHYEHCFDDWIASVSQ